MIPPESENLALFRQTFEELYNQGNLALADEVFAPDFFNHAAAPLMIRGPESVHQTVTMLRTAFPDLHITIEELMASGEMVAARTTMSGTHLGPYMGLAPTGRSFQQAQMHFVRFRDGKAVAHWAVRDDLGLMRQLGVIVAPGGAK